MQINLENITKATAFLFVINAGIFAFGIISNSQDKIIQNYGFIPNNLFLNNNHFMTDSFVRLFTSMFIHAGIAHLIFNLIALAYLGGFGERSVGIPRFLIIYCTAGITGALLHGAISLYVLGSGNSILIGASGAISGVLGIAAALGNVRAYYWLAVQIVFALIGSFTTISISFIAHVGGFITGMLLTKLLIEIERKKRSAFWNSRNERF